MVYRGRHLTAPESALGQYLADARRIIDEAETEDEGEAAAAALSEELEGLRWFPLPLAAIARPVPDDDPSDGSDVTPGVDPRKS